MRAIAIFLAATAVAAVPGQIDSICKVDCEVLAVREGRVMLLDHIQMRDLDLGKYAAAAQHLVPRTEAPVLDLGSPKGWRVVASVYLDHDEDDVLARLRFFEPNGRLKSTSDLLMMILQADIGHLFGGTDDVFAITSNEEHAYNAQSEIWLLPSTGDPRLLLEIQGDYGKFSGEGPGTAPGVAMARQTYDGIHAETKGTVDEFYAWDRAAKTLTLRGK